MYSSRRTQETTQTFRAAAAKQGTFKSHDLYSDWVTRKWELGGASASDNCEPELQKKHVALPPGRSLRNPNNWRFPMEKVTALLTVYPWPIWETALAKITSLLISSAGGGSDSHQLKGDWGGKLELPVKKGERKAKITNVQYHMRFFPRNPNTTILWEQALPLRSGMSGKKDCWMLGKQTEHMDGEQAKNCYKKCSLPFPHTCIRLFHFPMLLDPKAFLRLEISQTRMNRSSTCDAKRGTDPTGPNPSKSVSTDAQWTAAE